MSIPSKYCMQSTHTHTHTSVSAIVALERVIVFQKPVRTRVWAE
jgi:hypothetical protein